MVTKQLNASARGQDLRVSDLLAVDAVPWADRALPWPNFLIAMTPCRFRGIAADELGYQHPVAAPYDR